MSQIFDSDLDSLDLYMEALRIVHHHPRSDANGIFKHSTLAMDLVSCELALESLVQQGLLHTNNNCYAITAAGLQTLIPVKRDGKFPEVEAKSYAQVLTSVLPAASSISVLVRENKTTITKNGISIEFTEQELQQLWKKMSRELNQYS